MKERGSALVSVILVLLVLTIVGVGIAYFTSMEDRLSGNTRIAKAGFYAADAGLRRGESLLQRAVTLGPPCVATSLTLTNILGARSTPALQVPGGGYDALALDFSTIPGLSVNTCLGTDAAAKLINVQIPPPAGVAVVDRVMYSLYLRNNEDDATGSDVLDSDSIVNLISVGTVNLAAGTSVTHILEEQLLLTSGGDSTQGQKDVNAGGTNTISSQPGG